MPRLIPVFVAASIAAPVYAETVTVTAEDCVRATAHVADASVAFKPGIGADGKPVAPADLPSGSRFKLPETLVIDITVPIRKSANTEPGKAKAEATLSIGKLAVDVLTGRMTLDGEPLGDPEVAAIAEACRRAGAGG